MNTEFYRLMLNLKREKELSSREFAKEVDLSYGYCIEFFNKDKPFRLLTDKTMAKLHNKLGIDYKIMEEYNKELLKERKG